MKRKVCQSYVKTRKTGDINPYNSSKIRDCLKIYTISPEYLTAEKFYPFGTTEAAGGTAGHRASPRFPQRGCPQAGGAKDQGASEIEVRPGATWIDRKYVQEFMYETLRPPLPVPGHQTIYCGGRIVPHHKAVLPRS